MAFIILIFPYPMFSTAMYFSNRNDPARVMYTYPLSDVFAFIVGLGFIWPSLKEMRKAPLDKDVVSLISSTSASALNSYT